jgi:hypothetical protein
VRKIGIEHIAGLALFVVLLTATVLVATSPEPHPGLSQDPLRSREPVEIAGKALSHFGQVSLDQMWLEAYDGSAWRAIPFQFDEVNAVGVYGIENHVLDDNDVLVFMAMDLGQRAAPSTWISDTNARKFDRYEIEVTDPLSPTETGWVYLYHSPTLSPTRQVDYVKWDAEHHEIRAISYTLSFSPAVHAGLNRLTFNGSNVNVLDRTMLRVNATCYILGYAVGSQTLTENDLAGALDVTPSIEGPVRVGGGSVGNSSWFYASLFRLQGSLSLNDIPPPSPCGRIAINWIRLSNDWLNPAHTGMAPMTYYDANTPDGVPVDGRPDFVPNLPFSPWMEESGALGGVMQVALVTLEGGEIWNYYRDDDTPDPSATGRDKQSFGSAGVFVNGPSGQVTVGFVAYILAPEAPNLGARYQASFNNPLQFTTRAQPAPKPTP